MKDSSKTSFSSFVFAFVYIIALVFCTFIAAIALCASCYPDLTIPLMNVVVLGSGSPLWIVRQLLAPLAVTALAALGFMRLPRVLEKHDKRRIIVISLAASLIIQIVWIVMLLPKDYNSFADTIALTQIADKFLAGDYSVFQDASQFYDDQTRNCSEVQYYYMNLSPYQAGALFVFIAFRGLFGAACYPAFQIVNALAGTGTIALLIQAVNITAKDNDLIVKMTSVSLAAFIPFLLSCSFVYTNSIGLCLAAGSIAVAAKAFANRRTMKTASCCLLVAASYALAIVAIMLKPTLILVAIAETATWIMFLIREHKIAAVPVMLVMALVVTQASSFATKALETMTDVEFGPGLTKTSFIVMGTSWSDIDDLPGWYHSVVQYALDSNGDAAEQNRLAMEALGQNASDFVANPAYAAEFFGTKLATEWADPSYEAFWFSRCSIPDGEKPPALYLASAKSPLQILLVVIFDGLQTLLYACAAIEFFALVREARRSEFDYLKLLLALLFICGFGCYFFWEAQSMYILPFALLLIPLASSGILRAKAWLAKRKR